LFLRLKVICISSISGHHFSSWRL